MMSNPEQEGDHERAAYAALSSRDLELIQEQCEIQSATSPEQILGMTQAFAEAKRVALTQPEQLDDSEYVVALVKRLGAEVESENEHGWRGVPVTFRSGDTGEHPELIDESMRNWAEAYAERTLDDEELYYRFEKIHPFSDGNGRAGHCLWAIARARSTGTWPQELPPEVFSGEYRPPRGSAFGDIEEE